MIDVVLPNIPRNYTALTEWLACLVFILPLAKRQHWQFTLLVMGLGQLALQQLVGAWPLSFWIVGMALNVCWMFMTLCLTTTISLKNAGYLCCKAFIMAEFIASLAWQMYCHLVLYRFDSSPYLAILINTSIYLLILGAVFFFEKKLKRVDGTSWIQTRSVLIAILTAMIIFAMSNIGFILSTTTYSFGDNLSVFFIRTLVNLCGICILYMQENQQYEYQLQHELKAVNNIFQNHYEQYLAYKESATLIEQKAHDLKHQIEVIRLETDVLKKEHYLDDMTQAINTFSSNIYTGNSILDTILSRKNAFCLQQDIRFTCIVDGDLLNGLDTMDICSLFGNALDNAIEAVLTILETEQRLINLRVFKRNDFVMILLENYANDTLELSDSLPETTKEDKNYHGYGLKSIAYIAKKYDGNMTVSMKNNWFSLKVLLPLNDN